MRDMGMEGKAGAVSGDESHVLIDVDGGRAPPGGSAVCPFLSFLLFSASYGEGYEVASIRIWCNDPCRNRHGCGARKAGQPGQDPGAGARGTCSGLARWIVAIQAV